MLKASETHPATPPVLSNEIRCTNPNCGKLLAKGDEIKCRCGTHTTTVYIPLHFPPTKAIGGGTLEDDWKAHLAKAQVEGCETCGIKPGENITGRFILNRDTAQRVVVVQCSGQKPVPEVFRPIRLTNHFYPGKAMGGGSLVDDWNVHLAEAKHEGCKICGLEPGQSPDGIVEFRDDSPWRLIPYGSSAPKPASTPKPVASIITTPEATAVSQTATSGSHALAALYTPVPASLDTIGTDYKLPVFAAADPEMLAGARVLVISADGPELPEIHVPMEYLRARGADVKLAGQDWIFQWRTPAAHIVIAEWLSDRVCVKADLKLSDARLEDYDAVFIPGGAWNPDMLRTDNQALRIVREAHAKGLLVVSLCHGPQVIINAAFDAPEGQKNFPNIGVHITGTGSIHRDLKNAGFIVHNDQATVYDESSRLLTARDPNDLGPLCEKFGELLKKRLAA